jgi:hypothetical protein
MTKEEFDALPRLPARITAQMVAWLLGLKAEDLSISAVKKLVPPLNDLGPGIVRYWSAAEVLLIAKDSNKLRLITKAIYLHWKNRSSSLQS